MLLWEGAVKRFNFLEAGAWDEFEDLKEDSFNARAILTSKAHNFPLSP